MEIFKVIEAIKVLLFVYNNYKFFTLFIYFYIFCNVENFSKIVRIGLSATLKSSTESISSNMDEMVNIFRNLEKQTNLSHRTLNFPKQYYLNNLGDQQINSNLFMNG